MPSREFIILILFTILVFYLISKLLNKAFHKMPNHQYDDILLDSGNDMTQIDHIVISVNGIYVVETKNFEG